MTAGVSGWADVSLAMKSITTSFTMEVASDVSPAGVLLLQELYVGDEDAMSAPSGE